MLKFYTVNVIFLGMIMLLLLLDSVFSISIVSYVVVAILYLAIVTYGTISPSAQFFIPVKFKGDISSGAIAITFDDGPVPGKTEKILEILKSHKVSAAFFCVGHRIADNPLLAKKIHDSGHLLGNHSYWHKNTFDLQTTEKIEQELITTNNAIEQAIGLKPKLFRPPFGVTNPMIAKAIMRGGFTAIGWSVRSFDTVTRNREALLKRLTHSVKGGDIILLHDYCDMTLSILPEFLDHIFARGLKVVRVDELLNEKAYA
jgi:peptidoglycan/xylan/chitin deacetylase (PgdA/CDA1 family)